MNDCIARPSAEDFPAVIVAVYNCRIKIVDFSWQ